jgi:hypothetical protein
MQHKHLFADFRPLHQKYAQKEQKPKHSCAFSRQQTNPGFPRLLHRPKQHPNGNLTKYCL